MGNNRYLYIGSIVISIALLCGFFVGGYYTILPDWLYDIEWYLRYILGSCVILFSLSLTQLSWEHYLNNLIVSSHVAIIAYFFFVYQLSVDGPLALLIVLLFVLLIIGVSIQRWRRIVIILPVSILILTAIFLILLPTYNSIPTKADFYDSWGTRLHVTVQDTPVILNTISANVVIGSTLINKEQTITIDINATSESYRSYIIRRPLSITFNSSLALYNTFVFVHFYDGEILVLPSQASMDIVYNDTGYTTTITGIYMTETLGSATGFIAAEIDRLQGLYMMEMKQYFIDAVGGNWTQNPSIDMITAFVLRNLAGLFPQNYGRNYAQYIDFQLLLGEKIKNENTDRYVTDSNNSLRSIVVKGLEKSRFLQFLTQ